MATFEEQIEGLTGITISYSTTVPTQDQLTEFLKNAVLDVTRTSIAVDPHSTFSFARASEKQVNNDYYKNTGQIIEVVRENGTSNDWRKARYIIPSDVSLVSEVGSFNYASKFNPAYVMLEEGLINVFPAPSENNAFKVYYINNKPVNANEEDLSYSDTTIKYFPDRLVHLVVLYAAIKCLEAQMADFNIQEEDFELATTTAGTIEVFKARYQEWLLTGQMAQQSSGGNQQKGGASNEEIMQTLRGMNDER